MPEITTEDEFGKSIVQCIIDFKLRNNLEIGSWDGLGSTQCFIKGMLSLDGDKSLKCVEIEKQRFDALIHHTMQYDWITCYNTTSVNISKLKNFNHIWNSPYNGLKTQYIKETVRGWYDRDYQMISSFETGLLDTVSDTFDGVLIDGGEFTGFEEFEYLKDKTRVFFLDDTYNAYKTNQVRCYLEQDSQWDLINSSKTLRNGFAIFARHG